MTLEEIWLGFQSCELHLPTPITSKLHFDNPFLVNYVVYHHYRSLGWVIKGGLKFCVDYLLYKRGPVFSHAEYAPFLSRNYLDLQLPLVRFALVVIPVYQDPQDQERSPFDLPNSTPFSWSWFSTINRVNSQVQKVLSFAI